MGTHCAEDYLSNAKLLGRHFNFNFERLINAKKEELTEIDGIGEVLAASIEEYFSDSGNLERLNRLLEYLEIKKEKPALMQNSNIVGKTFVITGKTEKFENRKKLQELIEDKGGKVSSSVSANTDYLIS